MLNSGLIFKWLKSENTSSEKSRQIARWTRKNLGLTSKQYRKMLSTGRAKTKVLERIMSDNEWDKIDFSKIPSKAGRKYKNAFARHDIERMKRNPEVKSYEAFAKDTTTKVNAKALYPYEVVHQALKVSNRPLDDTDRLMCNKYWDNLENVFKNSRFDGLAVVDTSASMTWHGEADKPINVAISLGMYCAEKARGPFAGHYISFSRCPRLVKVEGVDFCDKVRRIYNTNLCENTNIEATFDMLLNTALTNHCHQEELPGCILIISDQEFDAGRSDRHLPRKTLMENIEKKWNAYGYKMPNLVFWNVQARTNNIPMEVKDGISFVSGMSPSIFNQILSGKTAFDLMYEVLDQERYRIIH